MGVVLFLRNRWDLRGLYDLWDVVKLCPGIQYYVSCELDPIERSMGQSIWTHWATDTVVSFFDRLSNR